MCHNHMLLQTIGWRPGHRRGVGESDTGWRPGHRRGVGESDTARSPSAPRGSLPPQGMPLYVVCKPTCAISMARSSPVVKPKLPIEHCERVCPTAVVGAGKDSSGKKSALASRRPSRN